MNTKTNPWAAFGLLAALLALAGCPGGAVAPEPESVMELRSYAVPEGFDAKELEHQISASLISGDSSLGRAMVYPDGSVVVTAPRSVHEGLARLMADLARRGPRTSDEGPRSVTLRYWAIVGAPSDGSPDGTPETPALRRALGPVLAQLTDAYGPMRFGLLEEIRLTSLADGSRGFLEGGRTVVHQRIASGAPTVADIEIATLRRAGGPNHRFESRLAVTPGRFIVLAQSAYNDAGFLPAGWKPRGDCLLFLVVAEQAD